MPTLFEFSQANKSDLFVGTSISSVLTPLRPSFLNAERCLLASAAAPRSWKRRIERLPSDQRHRLLDLVATCESLAELRAWFRDAAK